MTMELQQSLAYAPPEGRSHVRPFAAPDDVRSEPKFVRISIIALATAFLSVFVVLPLVVV